VSAGLDSRFRGHDGTLEVHHWVLGCSSPGSEPEVTATPYSYRWFSPDPRPATTAQAPIRFPPASARLCDVGADPRPAPSYLNGSKP
jgi:hypothetical protein